MNYRMIILLLTAMWAAASVAGPVPDPATAVPEDTTAGNAPDSPTARLRPNATRFADLEATVFHREEPQEYASRGRRDPFRPMLADTKREGEINTDLLVLTDAVLTGIVWSNEEFLAMVKDKEGATFFLREGDRVYQGRVAEISQAQVNFELYGFGEYERVTLKVQR